MDKENLSFNKRLKILISAHELSPFLGSECSSGWNIITRLGIYHDITVLYAETNQFGTHNYKGHIDDYISKNGLISGVQFVSIPQPSFTKKVSALNKFFSHKRTSVGISLLYFLGVRAWEKSVYINACRIIKNQHYDLIHHFNHLSFREPGYLWKVNKPFIWGPTSGLSIIPNSFLFTLPIKEILYNLLRNFSNRFQFVISNRVLKTIHRSSLIYYVTKDDKDFFLKKHRNIYGLLDMGGYPPNKQLSKEMKRKKVKILWVGRFSYLKALNLLLYAIGRSKVLKSRLELVVIGDGPQKEYYKNIANKLNLNNIQWLGIISKKQVFEEMLESDLLVHTSIKEAASAVILESLSAGLPVICHDAFGMSFAVNDTCGIKVPFLSPEKSIEGFKNALEKICLNDQVITKLSKGALERAGNLTWDSMAETISNDYITVYDSLSIK